MTKRKDWTGKKYGRLTLVKPTTKRQSKTIIWEAICDCGTTTYVRPHDLTSGNTISCGCFYEETKISNAKKNAEKGRVYDPRISSARAAWRNTYSNKDRRLGREGLDFESFLELSQQPCGYCGREPFRIFNVGLMPQSSYKSENQRKDGYFIYNGLDRLDNTKGHSRDNVVPCCKDCNLAKRSLSESEFLKLVELIYHNRIRSPRPT